MFDTSETKVLFLKFFADKMIKYLSSVSTADVKSGRKGTQGLYQINTIIRKVKFLIS